MIEEYLHAKSIGARHAGKVASERTLAAYGTALRRAEAMVGKNLLEWNEGDGDTLIDAMALDGLSPAYRANILAAVRGFFAWARSKNVVNGQPLEGITTPQIKRKIPTILNREQIETFFHAIDNRKYRLFFQLMYYGSLRIGEVTQLRTNDISQTGIIVRGKGGRQRFVYLPEWLLSALWDFSAHNKTAYVFESDARNAKRGEPLTLVTARETFTKAARKTGLPKEFHPHNLRHSSATHFHEQVGDLAMTQKRLGHTSPETTTIYAHIADDRLHKAAQKVFG